MNRLVHMALLLAIAIIGCRAHFETNTHPPAGNEMTRFSFSTSSDDGRQLVHGTLHLRWPIGDGQSIEGRWESHAAAGGDADPARIGPQIGSGTLLAERDGEKVRINLNPEMNDNNVMVAARIEPAGLRGRWEYVTFVGPVASGQFVATVDPKPASRRE